jgi:hypothetical protein
LKYKEKKMFNENKNEIDFPPFFRHKTKTGLLI